MAGPRRRRTPAGAIKCTGLTQAGKRCGNAALPGSIRCAKHPYKVPGRPSKLTLELQETILESVRLGAYVEVACQVAGVNKTTYYRWLRRAEEAEAKALEHFDSETEPDLNELYAHVDPADWVYLDFCHALKATEAFAEVELMALARTGIKGWQAQMTFLERRHPAKWGRRDSSKVEVSGTVGARVELVVPETTERRLAVASILSTAGALTPENTTEEDPDGTDDTTD